MPGPFPALPISKKGPGNEVENTHDCIKHTLWAVILYIFNFYYQVKTSLKVKVKVSQTCAVPINKINFYVPQQHDAQSIEGNY